MELSLARMYTAFSPSIRASPVVNRSWLFSVMRPRVRSGGQVPVRLRVSSTRDLGPRCPAWIWNPSFLRN
jgi:hypothetical protein